VTPPDMLEAECTQRGPGAGKDARPHVHLAEPPMMSLSAASQAKPFCRRPVTVQSRGHRAESSGTHGNYQVDARSGSSGPGLAELAAGAEMSQRRGRKGFWLIAWPGEEGTVAVTDGHLAAA
jgi:hypothetical protein